MSGELDGVRQDFEKSAFWNFLGLELVELRNGYAKLKLPIQSSFINAKKSVHGGVYASILDTTMGMATRSLGYEKVVTLQMNIQFLKSIENGIIKSEATVLNQSHSTALIESKLFDEENNLIAFCTGTFKTTMVDNS